MPLRPDSPERMARDFDTAALHQIAQLAHAHCRTLQRYATTPFERSASFKFHQLAIACDAIRELQRKI